jgi:hypothetical protein
VFESRRPDQSKGDFPNGTTFSGGYRHSDVAFEITASPAQKQ